MLEKKQIFTKLYTTGLQNFKCFIKNCLGQSTLDTGLYFKKANIGVFISTSQTVVKILIY